MPYTFTPSSIEKVVDALDRIVYLSAQVGTAFPRVYSCSTAFPLQPTPWCDHRPETCAASSTEHGRGLISLPLMWHTCTERPYTMLIVDLICPLGPVQRRQLCDRCRGGQRCRVQSTTHYNLVPHAQGCDLSDQLLGYCRFMIGHSLGRMDHYCRDSW